MLWPLWAKAKCAPWDMEVKDNKVKKDNKAHALI